jgi:Sap, sulfolipid-1-addressing protein
VLAEATGFALLAAISPTALLVMAVFLSSASPRATALSYVAGAVAMTVAMAVTVLFVLRAAGLDQPREREPRYWLRFALGVLALAVAVVISRRRRPAPADGASAARPPGFLARLTANPGPLTAFLAGLLLFAPSATFIAAVQAVATADADVPVTVLALLIVVTVTVLIVWLPLIGYLAAPDATTRALQASNGWLRAHSRALLAGGLWIAGVALVVNGALGVWG